MSEEPEDDADESEAEPDGARRAKTARLKKLVEEGRYPVDSEAVADGLMRAGVLETEPTSDPCADDLEEGT